MIQKDTIFQAYIEANKQVLKNGRYVKSNTPGRSDVLQLDNIFSRIDRPHNQIVQHPYWYGAKLDKYKNIEIVDTDFEYTYIDRLRDFIDWDPCGKVIDQLNECVDILRKDNGSRRGLATTWRPEIDLFKEEVPCMIMNQFKINDGVLNVNAVWRSHDIFGAYYPNLILLFEIQKYVAIEVGVDTGKMYVLSMNPHIYMNNVDEAEDLVRKFDYKF